MTMKPARTPKKYGFVRCGHNASCFSARTLNAPSESCTSTSAATVATVTYNIDSTINCRISVRFCEPSTFRTPTSLARLLERAVDKFMKLMDDSTRTSMPTAPKIVTNSGFPEGRSEEHTSELQSRENLV